MRISDWDLPHCADRQTSPMLLADLRPAVRASTRLELDTQHRSHAGGRRRARLRLRPHAKTHKSPALARAADRARRGRHLLRQARRGGGVRRRGHRRHPASLSAQSGQRRPRASPARPHAPLVHRRRPGRRAGVVGRDARGAGTQRRRAGQGGRRVPSLRHRSRSAATRRSSCARIAELPGLPFRGLLSHAGHGYGATSEDETAAIAAAEAQLLRDSGGGSSSSACACEEISVGATPTARFSVQQEGLTELRPGNYIYFDRTQVGARRRGVGRLRADGARAGREPPGAGSRHPRQRQQDADERPGARLQRHAGLRRRLHATSRPTSPDDVAADRAAVGGARQRAGR